MTDDKRCLFIFASNFRPLYERVALEAMGLPRDWVIHFRYEQTSAQPLLDDEVWSALPQAGNSDGSLANAPVLISYVNQLQTDRGFDIKAIVPLRTGRVLRAYRSGQVAHIYVQIRSHVRLGKPPLDDVASCTTLIQSVLTAKAPPHHYAAMGTLDIESLESAESESAFQDATYILSRAGFKGDRTVFVQVHGVKPVGGRRAIDAERPLKVRQDKGVSRAYYSLTEGKDYAMDVSVHLSESLQDEHLRGAAIVVDLDPEETTPRGRMQYILDGRYDRIAFPFTARRRPGKRSGLIQLRVMPYLTERPKPTGGDEVFREFRAAEWELPLQIKPQIWRRLGRTVPDILVAAGGGGLTATLALFRATVGVSTNTGGSTQSVASPDIGLWVALWITVGAAGVLLRALRGND